jgi:hypothetical protein
MPPLTPPGLSPSAAPGEVAFAWSSIRGGTGAAMADCANSLGAGRQVRYVAAVATRTNTPAAACKLMATGRQTASRRSMCSVQQIDDAEKREAGCVESTRSSARGVRRPVRPEIEQKKLTATSSAPSEWRVCVREHARKRVHAPQAQAGALPTVPAGGRRLAASIPSDPWHACTIQIASQIWGWRSIWGDTLC